MLEDKRISKKYLEISQDYHTKKGMIQVEKESLAERYAEYLSQKDDAKVIELEEEQQKKEEPEQ